MSDSGATPFVSPIVSSSQDPPAEFAPPPQKSNRIVRIVIGAIGAGLLLLAIGVVALVLWSVRQADILRMAMERVRQDPTVVSRLGTPIEAGWLISGSMNIENDSGTAAFTVPIHGPRQEATVFFDARKNMGEWTFKFLTVKTADGERINVIKGPEPGPSGPAF